MMPATNENVELQQYHDTPNLTFWARLETFVVRSLGTFLTSKTTSCPGSSSDRPSKRRLISPPISKYRIVGSALIKYGGFKSWTCQVADNG